MAFPERDPQLPAVGSRINYASNLGVVRYVGEVKGTTGIWLGVEWDDPRRGKHGGSKDGRQYFTTTAPNSATFVRPSTSISLGQSFLRALFSKYVQVPFESSSEKVMLGSSNGTIQVEAVGMNKVRSKLSRLDTLREVSLDMENVAYADPPGEIRKTCPNVKGLDLSRTLVPSWETIALIASELPMLETLSLNFTRLQLASQDITGGSFTRVKDLRLNGTLTTWDTMIALLPLFPELLHIEMGLNHLEALAVPVSSNTSAKLSSINLEQNELRDWQHIMHSVAVFSQLDRLIISGNLITAIPPLCEPSDQLPQIKHLVLVSNSIRAWSDINALCGWFPQLHTLNINSNPIDREPSSRSLIIARLSSLTALNASTVSAAERRDSELFYLSFIGKARSISRAEREREFPRYRELCDKYGEPEEEREVHADTLSSRLIEVHFFRLSSPVSSTTEFDLPEPSFSLQILPSMTLRVLCSKVLKTLKARARIQMWLVLERQSLHEFAEMKMEFASRSVEWWGVENNCKVAFFTK